MDLLLAPAPRDDAPGTAADAPGQDRDPAEHSDDRATAGGVPSLADSPDSSGGAVGLEHGPVAPATGLVPVPGVELLELPVEAISPNPRQPRRDFDDASLAELVDSVREIGVLQPVVVRRVAAADRGADDAADDGADDRAGGGAGHGDAATSGARYELVMGERRWRASRAAGLTTVPAIVRETRDDALLRDALLENLHRADLNPLEEAAAYQQLLEDFGCTHDELARRIGRSRPQITNTVRLLRLPPAVQRRVVVGALSAGHARALLGLPDADAMERLAQRVDAENLSVRATEEAVALGGAVAPEVPRTRTSAVVPPDLARVAARLADALGTQVVVVPGRRRGRLVIDFAGAEDLTRIAALLAPGDDSGRR